MRLPFSFKNLYEGGSVPQSFTNPCNFLTPDAVAAATTDPSASPPSASAPLQPAPPQQSPGICNSYVLARSSKCCLHSACPVPPGLNLQCKKYPLASRRSRLETCTPTRSLRQNRFRRCTLARRLSTPSKL